MIINQNTLNGLYREFLAIFNKVLGEAPSDFKKIATIVPSSSRSVDYNWLLALPGMREWLGDRQHKDVAAAHYEITNKDWEASVEVDRNDIMDDQIGQYSPMVQMLAQAAATHPDELVFALLAGGFTAECHDGQYFFDTDHPVGETTGSNHGGGSSTPWFLLDVSKAVKPLIFQSRTPLALVAMDKPDDENVYMRKKYRYGCDARYNVGYGLWQLAYGSKQSLDSTYYGSARAAMMAFKNDEGRPMNIKPNLLVVPPSLEGDARALLMNERDSAGATNKWRGTADLLVAPWLA